MPRYLATAFIEINADSEEDAHQLTGAFDGHRVEVGPQESPARPYEARLMAVAIVPQFPDEVEAEAQ